MSVEQALSLRRSLRRFADAPLALADVGQILWAGQGVTGPDGRRAAPSAAATFPLETYLVAGRIEGLDAGVYRYDPAGHSLAMHVAGDLRTELAQAAWNQLWMAAAPVTVVLACVVERNTKRFGKHGLHFIDMEVGHVAENLALQAVALEMGTVMVGAFDIARAHSVLRLPAEQAVTYLVPVGKPAGA